MTSAVSLSLCFCALAARLLLHAPARLVQVLVPYSSDDSRVAEASAIVQKLRALAEGDVGRAGTGIAGKSTANASSGLEVAVANLQDYCNELENRLLSRFDMASHKRELATMAECAKILVQFNRGTSAMQRYIASRPMFIDVEIMAMDKGQSRENMGCKADRTFLQEGYPLSKKKLLGGDPAAPRNAFLEQLQGLASMARLPWGSKAIPEVATARASKGQPPKLFQVYEFEACPFCRRVREALTELDLSAEVYPCPKGSVRHREFVRQVGGKDQFPFFVDPNTGVTLYESCTCFLTR